jgi:hypothetical protein
VLPFEVSAFLQRVFNLTKTKRYLVRFPARPPDNVICFRGFSQSIKEIAGIIPVLGYDRFVPNPL